MSTNEQSLKPTSSDVSKPLPVSTTPAPSEAAKPMLQLPPDYLKHGFYKGEGNKQYPDPNLVPLAHDLASLLHMGGLTPARYNPLLRDLKRAKKKSLPFEAKTGAVNSLIPKALRLVAKKQAPELLVKIIQANLTALKNPEDYPALYDHFENIGAYLQVAATSTDPSQTGGTTAGPPE